MFFTVALVLLVGAFATCNNPADIAALQDADAVTAMQQKCGSTCLARTPVDKCIGKCMVAKAHVSKECSTCFGDNGSCTLKKCLTSCISPSSQSCLLCSLEKCGKDLRKCTEIAPCADDKDTALLKAGNALTAKNDCVAKCSKDSNPFKCGTTCFASATKVSSVCAACSGEEAQCLSKHTPEECAEKTTACVGFPLSDVIELSEF